jgi:hypothetical protein
MDTCMRAHMRTHTHAGVVQSVCIHIRRLQSRPASFSRSWLVPLSTCPGHTQNLTLRTCTIWKTCWVNSYYRSYYQKVDTFNYPKIKSSKPLCLEITPATASGILYQKRSGSLHDLGLTSNLHNPLWVHRDCFLICVVIGIVEAKMRNYVSVCACIHVERSESFLKKGTVYVLITVSRRCCGWVWTEVALACNLAVSIQAHYIH